MNKDNRKSFLELNIIWKDEHMFELQVTATNGRYSGMTEVYAQSKSLEEFAKTLYRFPNDNEKLFYEAGEKDSYSYFSMKFYCIDSAGHIGLEVNLEENVATEFRHEEKDKLKLEIIVEPAAIDNFQKELLRLATQQEGKAVLLGRDN